MKNLACALGSVVLLCGWLASPAHATFIDATYLTQTPNGLLNHEQALSTLSSGCLSVTTSTGVVASTGAACLGTHNFLSATHPDTVAATPNLGDLVAGNVSNLWAVLAGSTSATDKCLHQLGTGTGSALPTWSGCGVVNAQTGTTYTVLASDNTKLVTTTNASAIAVTVPQAGTAGFASGFMFFAENRGVGTATYTPTTSTIDGAASIALTTNQGLCIFSDGTNYFTGCRGTGGGGVTGSSLTSNLPVIGASGSAVTVGTRSGNTTQYVTTTGTQTSGDCVKIDASGNHVANGSACGSGGGDTFALNFQSGGVASSSGAMAQNTTYFLVQDGVFSASGLAGGVTVPKTGTLTAVYWRAYIQGSTGTATQLLTHKVRKNNTTDTTGCTTDYSAAQDTCSETGLSFAVTAGDYLEFKVVTPVTWTTAAGSVRWTIALTFTNP